MVYVIDEAFAFLMFSIVSNGSGIHNVWCFGRAPMFGFMYDCVFCVCVRRVRAQYAFFSNAVYVNLKDIYVAAVALGYVYNMQSVCSCVCLVKVYVVYV